MGRGSHGYATRKATTMRVEELAEGKPVTIGADDSVEEALHTMMEHHVRRLPVIDGHRLIGIVSQADVAKNLPEDKVGELVEAISGAAPNNQASGSSSRKIAPSASLLTSTIVPSWASAIASAIVRPRPAPGTCWATADPER